MDEDYAMKGLSIKDLPTQRLPTQHLPAQRLPTKHSPTKRASIQHASVIRELQLATDIRQRRSIASNRDRAGAMTNPDLISVIFLCIIACLIAVNLILRAPNAGLIIEQFNQF
jgi:hypothetical protein